MSKIITAISVPFVALAISTPYQVLAIESFPMLDRLSQKGNHVSSETLSWMQSVRELNLEEIDSYRFDELAGASSITLKIKKLDPSSATGLKSLGSYVPRNASANPNTEIAYFDLAAIFGLDYLFRPAERYSLGPYATAVFKQMILSTTFTSANKLKNRDRIIAAIDTGQPLLGCVKAKKPSSATSLDSMKAVGASAPNFLHAVVQSVQASNPVPQPGTMIALADGFTGDAYTLAREYSILMTFDAVFGQWDRYSGGNVGIRRDANGLAHFYSTDNGGADLGSIWTARQLSWFSRYDRNLITQLAALNSFLNNPSTGYLGYTDANEFVVDLGLYFERSPQAYVEKLRANIAAVLARVHEVELQYGPAAYFPD